MRIGVDIGGVIMAADNDRLFFSDNFLMTKQEDYAFFSILLMRLAGHELFFISKAAPKNVERTRLWLDAHDFFDRTGTESDNLVFCKERHQKVQIASLLELDVMIDDRIDICLQMESAGIAPIQFNNWPETLDIIGDLDYAKSNS